VATRLPRSEVKVDQWLKDVAPSTELRRWFGHDPKKWAEFRRRYEAELAHNPSFQEFRALLRREKRVTLLFAARDAEHNNAAVLRELCMRP